ncbi:MAG: hypothetical protein PHO53_00370, partial [Actinomycetota bacterium]|nr:hypothetical protein [Actinomycetota bacterium]
MAEPARARASYQHEERPPHRTSSLPSRQRNSPASSSKKREAETIWSRLREVLHNNYLLLLPVFLLVFIGFVMVLSASSSLNPSGTIKGYRYIFQQVGCALGGGVLMLFFALIG